MKTQPQAPLDKFVLGVLEGFYIYVISRRLAELLINFKKSDWLPCRSSTKDTGAIFYCFQRAPGQSLKKRMQFGPAQNKMYIITQWTEYRYNHT